MVARNWALVIGINNYFDFLQPLKYAKRDAQLMHDFLRDEAGFKKIFFFSDDSPNLSGKSTRPYRTNLLRVLRQLFETPFMGPGDNFWFFFSGHGIRHNNRDYLMPCDGDPEDIKNTAISINFVTERLRRCGADNVVLILDACRSLGAHAGEGIGRQTASRARQTGVISIFSCSPNEYSYEIDALQQGAFTHVLLDGLGIRGRGQCATVEQLDDYLSVQVPEIVRQYKNAQQTPYIIAEPINKSHLILIPRYAKRADIDTLKIDAYRAQTQNNFDLAKQLWIRVLLATSSGSDIEHAIEALQEIAPMGQDAGSRLSEASQNSDSLNDTPYSSPPEKNESESKSPTPAPSNEHILQSPITDDLNTEGSKDDTENTPIGVQTIEPTKELFQQIFSSVDEHYKFQNWLERDPNWWVRDNKFQQCIEAILLQGTAWKNVESAINNLKAQNDALTPSKIYEMPEEQLRKLIQPCGRAKTKASYIKQFVYFLKKDYELELGQMLAEDTDSLRTKLTDIKGIGKFTADNIVLYVADRPKIPINNRIRKVFYEHDLIDRENEPYDSVQSLMERIAPFTTDQIRQFDAMIYYLTKDYCHSTPKCEQCPLKQFLPEQVPRSQRISGQSPKRVENK